MKNYLADDVNWRVMQAFVNDVLKRSMTHEAELMKQQMRELRQEKAKIRSRKKINAAWEEMRKE